MTKQELIKVLTDSELYIKKLLNKCVMIEYPTFNTVKSITYYSLIQRKIKRA